MTLSILLSISIAVLPVFTLNYLCRTPIGYYSAAGLPLLVTLICVAVYFLRTKKIPEFYLEVHEYDMQKMMRVLCVGAMLIATFLLVYSIHQYYPYPYLLDEWQHIAQGIQVADRQGIAYENPYYKNADGTGEAGYYEKGFHVFLAECFMLTGQEPTKFYTYLPALFAAIAALTVFTFTYKASNSYATGLLAMMFYAALRSNVSILGPWFYVPETMGFAYIYAILYLVDTGLERYSIRLLTLSSILTLTLAIIYPSSAAVAYIAAIIYVAMRRDTLGDKNIWLIAGTLAIPLLSTGYLLDIMNRGTTDKTPAYLITNHIISGLGIQVRR